MLHAVQTGAFSRRVSPLILVSLLINSLAWQSVVPVARASADCQDRVAILLDGYGSSSDTVESAFADVRAKVLPTIGYKKIIFFSYRYPNRYTKEDTYNGLPNAGIEALRSTIKDVLSGCAEATIDLIGYSLGGAIAWAYASVDGINTAQGKHIHHLVTLDSPVNGSSNETLLLLSNAFGLTAMVGTPVGLYLRAQHQSANTEKQNEMILARLSSRMVIRTITSRDDLIVPADDGTLPGFDYQVRLGRAGGDQVAWLGHSQVLHAQSSLDRLAKTLRLQSHAEEPRVVADNLLGNRASAGTVLEIDPTRAKVTVANLHKFWTNVTVQAPDGKVRLTPANPLQGGDDIGGLYAKVGAIGPEEEAVWDGIFDTSRLSSIALLTTPSIQDGSLLAPALNILTFAAAMTGATGLSADTAEAIVNAASIALKSKDFTAACRALQEGHPLDFARSFYGMLSDDAQRELLREALALLNVRLSKDAAKQLALAISIFDLARMAYDEGAALIQGTAAGEVSFRTSPPVASVPSPTATAILPSPTLAPPTATATATVAPATPTPTVAPVSVANEIAYVSAQEDLWVATIDGTNARKLIAGPVAAPRWSRDGKRIAYYRIARSPGTNAIVSLWIANADGSNPRRVTPEIVGHTNVQWGPGDTSLYYVTGRQGSPETIFKYDLTTNRGEELDLNGWVFDVAIDGTVAFHECDSNSRCSLNAISPTGQRTVLLPGGFSNVCCAAWSPDGSKIAMIRGSAIFVANRDGSGQRQIATPDSALGGLSWSPDSATLVFGTAPGVGPQSVSMDIWTVPAAGGKPVKRFSGTMPTWRPSVPAASTPPTPAPAGAAPTPTATKLDQAALERRLAQFLGVKSVRAAYLPDGADGQPRIAALIGGRGEDFSGEAAACARFGGGNLTNSSDTTPCLLAVTLGQAGDRVLSVVDTTFYHPAVVNFCAGGSPNTRVVIDLYTASSRTPVPYRQEFQYAGDQLLLKESRVLELGGKLPTELPCSDVLR